MGSRMVAVGTMPTKDDDIVPMMVTRSTMTHCGRADNDDNRPLMSDDRPDVLSHTHTHNTNKKLSYRRGTARCVVSIEILPIATQQCRNYLYDKS